MATPLRRLRIQEYEIQKAFQARNTRNTRNTRKKTKTEKRQSTRSEERDRNRAQSAQTSPFLIHDVVFRLFSVFVFFSCISCISWLKCLCFCGLWIGVVGCPEQTGAGFEEAGAALAGLRGGLLLLRLQIGQVGQAEEQAMVCKWNAEVVLGGLVRYLQQVAAQLSRSGRSGARGAGRRRRCAGRGRRSSRPGAGIGASRPNRARRARVGQLGLAQSVIEVRVQKIAGNLGHGAAGSRNSGSLLSLNRARRPGASRSGSSSLPMPAHRADTILDPQSHGQISMKASLRRGVKTSA